MQKRTVFCLAVATGAAAFFVSKNVDHRGLVSTLCEWLATTPAVEPDLARDAFTNTPVAPAALTLGHTHANAAALRTSATTFARRLADYAGVRLYVLAMSKSDQRKKLTGDRQWYWAKDTHVENRDDLKLPDDIEYICDVDYYMDMSSVLSARAKTTLLYACVPEEASSHGRDDTTTFFNAGGELVTLVAGGGRYCHHLWDYGYDSLIVEKRTLGITTKIITYAIERKQVGYARQLILLAPIREFRGVAAWLASWLLSGPRLKRFNPIVETREGDKFVRFEVHKSTETFVTTGKPDSLLCATIPAHIDATIAGVSKLGTTNLMLPTVASWLEKEERSSAVILTEYHRAALPKKLPVVFPVEQAVRAYQYEPKIYDQEAKPKLHAFMSPLVHGAFAPVANAAGERRCVQGRIQDLKKPEPAPHTFRDDCMAEFCELILDGIILEPVCYEVVEEKQTSATQILSLRKAVLHGVLRSRVLKCFIKAESYPDVKDPRNISTYNDADKLEMAQFALALSAHLKKFPWYGPGKTPLEIATRVAEICSNASRFVNVSDYHRMDGTVSYVLRGIDRIVCMKAFANHRTVLNELLKRNAGNFGYLPNGTTFEQGSSHGSGCSATSTFQSLRASFTSYLAYRHAVKPDGSKYSPREAFDALGIHLGDDGLDPDLPVGDHKWAADRVGLVLEAVVVNRKEPGVNFLARYYSEEVWEGSPNSMCDVKRQLSKFHTTVRLPANVTPEQKLVEKAMSYVATDGNTPVMGAFCKQVLVLSDYRPKTPLGVGTWWSRFADSVQYPNENVGGWMDVEFNRQFPEFDHAIFKEWMAGTKSVKTILAPPLCAEPKPATPAAVDVVVDGDVLSARTDIPPEEPTSESGTEASTGESTESAESRKRGKRQNAKKKNPPDDVKMKDAKSRRPPLPRAKPIKAARS